MNSNYSVAESFQETPIVEGEASTEMNTYEGEEEGKEQRVIGGVDESQNW